MQAITIEQFAKADLKELVKQLTVDEKIALTAGPDWWTTSQESRIPHIKCSDGPNGVRGSSHFKPTPANCIPCLAGCGATFDPELMYKVGGLLARDSKAKGSSLLLAPTVNIQRHPMNGRAFESFSEDPFLSGILAAGYVNGLQENGVGATIKHFVCNDMEHQRNSADIQVSERVLREIYLVPFMIAQRLSNPWSYMTAYSRINGTHCSENKRLLQNILREEWGFDGMVMSDWHGTYSTQASLEAGLDLEMPGPTVWRGHRVKVALNSKTLKYSDLDARALGVMKAIQKSVLADAEVVATNTQEEKARSTPEDIALNRKLAGDAIVLLKNSANLLPLDTKKVKKILVTGPNAKTRTVSGGGSAYLTTDYVITPYDGILAAAEEIGAEVIYSPGCYGYKYLPMLDGWIKAEDGSPGWTARFSNEPWEQVDKPLHTLTLPGTRLRINDNKPQGLADEFYVKCSGYLTADSTGPYQFGASVVGRCQVFINDELVLDNGVNTKQTRGDSFYGLGTIEETGIYNFEAGKTYHLTVEFNNVKNYIADDPNRGQPSLMNAAMRISGCPHIPDPEKAVKEAAELAKDCDAVICITGSNMDWESEGGDRPIFKLPGKTDELVEALLSANPNTVVVNQTGSAFAFPWVDKASTILQSWFGGSETGNAIADVVFGKINPSGRMPVSFPYKIEDCTAHLNWQCENGKVYYGEGVFVGYRGYDECARPAMFAFGEGLSYSSFAWSDFNVTVKEGKSAQDISATVTLTVTNTGKLPGSDVVQIYVTDPTASVRRPKKELKGFAKVSDLKPGEKKKVSIQLDKFAFSFYDEFGASWVCEAGEYEIKALRSSKDVGEDKLRKTVELKETTTWTGL